MTDSLQPGQIVRVRSHAYLVEGVTPAPQTRDNPLVRLSCVEVAAGLHHKKGAGKKGTKKKAPKRASAAKTTLPLFGTANGDDT